MVPALPGLLHLRLIHWIKRLLRNRFQSTGHVQDDATGLTYMQARFYDPVMGRFLSPDPVGFAEGGVGYFNRYAYVHNDPVNFTDPTGLERCRICTPSERRRVEPPPSNRQMTAQDKFVLGVVADFTPFVGSVKGGVDFVREPSLIGAVGILPFGKLARGSDYIDEGVELFRAVKPEELADIRQLDGAFRNPPGNEVKYFSTTEEGARQYGDMASEAYGESYSIVSTTIPNSSIDDIMRSQVDSGIDTVVVPTDKLRDLSRARELD